MALCPYFFDKAVRVAIGIFLSEKVLWMLLMSSSLAVLDLRRRLDLPGEWLFFMRRNLEYQIKINHFKFNQRLKLVPKYIKNQIIFIFFSKFRQTLLLLTRSNSFGLMLITFTKFQKIIKVSVGDRSSASNPYPFISVSILFGLLFLNTSLLRDLASKSGFSLNIMGTSNSLRSSSIFLFRINSLSDFIVLNMVLSFKQFSLNSPKQAFPTSQRLSMAGFMDFVLYFSYRSEIESSNPLAVVILLLPKPVDSESFLVDTLLPLILFKILSLQDSSFFTAMLLRRELTDWLQYYNCFFSNWFSRSNDQFIRFNTLISQASDSFAAFSWLTFSL